MSYSDGRAGDRGAAGAGRAGWVPRAFAVLVSAAFLAVGALGFVPGVTSGFDSLRWAGHASGAELFGVFQVSVLHNTVHLLFGVLGLAMASSASAATTYLLGGGAAYVGLAVYGWYAEQGGAVDLLPLDAADDWLHLCLGVGMLVLGLVALLVRRLAVRRGSRADARG